MIKHVNHAIVFQWHSHATALTFTYCGLVNEQWTIHDKVACLGTWTKQIADLKIRGTSLNTFTDTDTDTETGDTHMHKHADTPATPATLATPSHSQTWTHMHRDEQTPTPTSQYTVYQSTLCIAISAFEELFIWCSHFCAIRELRCRSLDWELFKNNGGIMESSFVMTWAERPCACSSLGHVNPNGSKYHSQQHQLKSSENASEQWEVVISKIYTTRTEFQDLIHWSCLEAWTKVVGHHRAHPCHLQRQDSARRLENRKKSAKTHQRLRFGYWKCTPWTLKCERSRLPRRPRRSRLQSWSQTPNDVESIVLVSLCVLHLSSLDFFSFLFFDLFIFFVISQIVLNCWSGGT